jgi:hypothetical protein
VALPPIQTRREVTVALKLLPTKQPTTDHRPPTVVRIVHNYLHCSDRIVQFIPVILFRSVSFPIR